MNAERRAEEERILLEALEQAEAQKERMGFVLYGADWHSGVIGIVASRIVEKYYRPTLILCSADHAEEVGGAAHNTYDDYDGHADAVAHVLSDATSTTGSTDEITAKHASQGAVLKGSGRSVPEFDLHGALVQCTDLFLAFGGHHQAAGMSLNADNLDALRERFDDMVRTSLGSTPLMPTIKIDAPLDFAGASNHTTLKELELLQPFGMGNPEPTFISPWLIIRSIRHFGRKKEHAELRLFDASCGIALSAKAWRQAHDFPNTLCDKYVRLAYTPKLDTYSGNATVDIKIKDWKLA